MFRFFKKKTDQSDPSAADQQPDSEVGQPAPEALAVEASEPSVLSRWFKRNPELPSSGGDVEPKPEDSADDEAVATAPDAAEEDDRIGDAWKGDPLDGQAEELEDAEVEMQSHGTGKYGRVLGTLMIDDVDINEKMVDKGHAIWYDGGSR